MTRVKVCLSKVVLTNKSLLECIVSLEGKEKVMRSTWKFSVSQADEGVLAREKSVLTLTFLFIGYTGKDMTRPLNAVRKQRNW